MLENRRDRGWAWIVLFVVTLSQVMLGGIGLSGGVFYVIFMEALDANPVETSWLCTRPMSLWFLGSPVGSFLTNRYGSRKCAFIGGVLAASALAISYFATSIYFLFFSYGFLTGLGFGVTFTGGMAAVNVYFDKYKTLATGITSLGHNAGMIIYAKLTVFLGMKFGWRGMMLIQGAIVLNISVCACALFSFDEMRSSEANEDVCIKTNKSLTTNRSINFTAFKNVSFLFFCVSNVLGNIGLGTLFLHLPPYSRNAGFSDRDIGLVLMIFAITNILGKLMYSFLGQHPKVNVTLLYTVSLTATGIFTGLFPVFLSKIGILILSGLVGYFSSVTGALLQAVVFQMVGNDRFADGLGFAMPFKAAGNFIGGPLAGALLASTGSYTFSFYLADCSIILSSLFMAEPVIRHRKNDQDNSTACTLGVNDTRDVLLKGNVR